MKSEDVLKLENQLCFPVYTLSKEIINIYRPYLEALDISYSQYLVLMVLWEQDGMTVSEICDKLFLDTGTVTPMLKRMEGKEILTRTRKKEDERVVEVKLTSKGKSLKSKATHIPYQLVKDIALGEEELAFLKSITRKILNITNK